MKKWIPLAALLLAACTQHQWVNQTANDPGALNIASGECTAESYKVVPVPRLQEPARPVYGAAPQYKTDYQLQSSSGARITGTSTTTAQNDMWLKQQEYQAAKSAHDSQLRRASLARQRVFNGCMQAKGWAYVKVER
jgi:hypothetical protein